MAFVDVKFPHRQPSIEELVRRTKDLVRRYAQEHPLQTEQEAMFVAALLGERPPAGADTPNKPGSNVKGMSKAEAHLKLLTLILEDASAAIELSQTALGQRVGCSVNTLKKTDAWRVIKPFREQPGSADRGKLIRAAMERLVLDGGGDDALRRLTEVAVRTKIRRKI